MPRTVSPGDRRDGGRPPCRVRRARGRRGGSDPSQGRTFGLSSLVVGRMFLPTTFPSTARCWCWVATWSGRSVRVAKSHMLTTPQPNPADAGGSTPHSSWPASRRSWSVLGSSSTQPLGAVPGPARSSGPGPLAPARPRRRACVAPAVPPVPDRSASADRDPEEGLWTLCRLSRVQQGGGESSTGGGCPLPTVSVSALTPGLGRFFR